MFFYFHIAALFVLSSGLKLRSKGLGLQVYVLEPGFAVIIL